MWPTRPADISQEWWWPVPIRPIAVPLFGTDPADPGDIVEPTELIRLGGWLANERPAAPHVNWQFRQAGDWIDFLRGPGSANWERGAEAGGCIDTSDVEHKVLTCAAAGAR